MIGISNNTTFLYLNWISPFPIYLQSCGALVRALVSAIVV